MHWRPSASIPAIRARAAMLADIRKFFADAGVLEVETPLLGKCFPTEPSIQPLTCIFEGPSHGSGLPLYLQSSPEYAMKRLLAAGVGPVYQIGKAFRNGESGRLHNPEFTLLEWYRPGFSLPQLMDEVADLVSLVLGDPPGVEKIRYRDLFRKHLDLDPLSAGVSELADLARERLGAAVAELAMGDRDQWLDLLMTHLLEDTLGREGLTFVHDYPASQAALAQLHPEDPRVAQRFELYYRGIELANGYQELTDARVQRARFEEDNRQRRASSLPTLALDQRMLAALEHGLPACSGVALGLDRLLMLAIGADRISEVIAFPLPDA